MNPRSRDAQSEFRTARAALASLADEAFSELIAREDIGKVSVVGAGMRSHPGVAASVFRVLREVEPQSSLEK